MITTRNAIATARGLLGTPYAEMDCINLIKAVIRRSPGGVPDYTTAGTNTLWNSYDAAPKYRDLIWRQESTEGARAGMLAFKRSGEDVHHVGLVTFDGTVVHSSSAQGMVVETPLDGSWNLLGIHRYIEAASTSEEEEGEEAMLYQAVVTTERDPLRVRDAPGAPADERGLWEGVHSRRFECGLQWCRSAMSSTPQSACAVESTSTRSPPPRSAIPT